jgi:hypothetical protein
MAHELVEVRAVVALGALLQLRVHIHRHLRVGVADLVHDPLHVKAVGQQRDRDVRAPERVRRGVRQRRETLFGEQLASARGRLALGGTVSVVVTIEVNGCVVITPHGPGVTGTVGGAYGGGAGINIHAGVGGSNAQTPRQYGGFFGTAGGSAEAGFGVYGGGFASPPGP